MWIWRGCVPEESEVPWKVSTSLGRLFGGPSTRWSAMTGQAWCCQVRLQSVGENVNAELGCAAAAAPMLVNQRSTIWASRAVSMGLTGA